MKIPFVARKEKLDKFLQSSEALKKRSDGYIAINGKPPRQMEKPSTRLNMGMSITQLRVFCLS